MESDTQSKRVAERSIAAASAKQRTNPQCNFVVTERDVRILKYVHDYRLLSARHLVALLAASNGTTLVESDSPGAILTNGPSYTRVLKRLKGLCDHGYIKKRRRVPQEENIFSIGKAGLDRLFQEDCISEEDVQRRRREHELKKDTLPHELMISDIHAALEIASRESPEKLITWRQGKELHDTIEVYNEEGRYEKITIEPDAFFTLEGARDERGVPGRSFFLEADRSTMAKVPLEGSRRFHDKFRKYRLYIEKARRHEEKYKTYGIKEVVRVVIITKTKERRDTLAQDAAELLPKGSLRNFLVGWIGDFPLTNPTPIFESIFIRPGNTDKRFELLPKPSTES